MSKTENYRPLYEQYREVPLKDWTKRDPVAVAKDFKKHQAHVDVRDDKAFGTAFILAAKVAHRCEFEQFEVFMKTAELPPMKLSKTEMELMKGGGFPKWLAVGLGAVAVGAVAYGAYKMGNKDGRATGQTEGASAMATATWNGMKNEMATGVLSKPASIAVYGSILSEAGKNPMTSFVVPKKTN